MTFIARSLRLVLPILVVASAFSLTLGAGAALATTFTVNSQADTTECSATCTLRGAIAAAIELTDTSLEVNNTIIVPAGKYVDGPAEKSNPTGTGELRIDNPTSSTLTLDGAGAGSTVISAGQYPNGENDRVIQTSGGGNVVLVGLTIEKGFQHEDEAFSEEDVRGAGILQLGGALTLAGVRVTADKNNGWGGGVDVREHGKLTIENSEIDHDWTSVGGGGGVALEPGTLVATDTTIDNDTSAAGEGGGLQVMAGSQATLTNVTIADDGYVEGGLTYEGGGLYVQEGGTVNLTNVTFAGDLAGGNSGGGSDVSAQEPSHLTFKNVLLGKRPEEEAGENDCAGEEVGSSTGWLDEGGNLSADTTCAIAAVDMGVDLKLGELGMYGGSTPTVPLLEGSPAIDFGISGCPTTDQRGFPRVGICDSGAYEFQGPPSPSGGGTPGGPTMSQTVPPSASPPLTPALNIASTPKAIEEVLLGCSKRSLVLNDVLISGKHVLLNGSAAKSLVGKKIKILFDGTKHVATATVTASGAFSTTAPLPPARLRSSNSARYVAVAGAQRSLDLKLTRRLILQPPAFSAGKVTLTGEVVTPLAKPVGVVTVEQQLECGKSAKVLTFTPSPSGRFHVTVGGIPANAKAGIYRLTTSVLGSPHSRQAFRTFSLPLPVSLG